MADRRTGPWRSAILIVLAIAGAGGVGLSISGALEIGQHDETAIRPTTTPGPSPRVPAQLQPYFWMLVGDVVRYREAAEHLGRDWSNAHTPMLLEVARFSPNQRHVMAIAEQLTGQDFQNHNQAWQWVWNNDFGMHPDYPLFKTLLYEQVDPRFAAYFDDHTDNALIRLDEVRWGGVRRDGIPPLKQPAMLEAHEADYLGDDHVVFGIEINGDARAYPKRILAWHEMFKDTVGGVSINGVYCTLCGTVIIYRTEHNGTHHELGTSGFLYRSNKLMYDHATESLWSTLEGKPVIGPLVGRGIELESMYLVTTTWGQWRKQHPATTVLSLDTGHTRDYSEGAAYRSYFATDELMFHVPELDTRLKNKAEVLALRFGGDATPAAIETAMLSDQSVYHGEHGGTSYVVLTDAGGANRVYDVGETRITGYDRDGSATDANGRRWRVREDALVAEDGARHDRLPAHRAFWFGWYSAHPDTELIR